MSSLELSLFGATEVVKHKRPVALTIGNFDGVHLGHQFILNELKRASGGLDVLAITFMPHPTRIFLPENPKKLIISLKDRVSQLLFAGCECVCVQDFDQNFANMSAKDFCEEFLAKNFNIKFIMVGSDFHYGKKREGNFQTLQRYCEEVSWTVLECPSFLLDNEKVSSSAIRTAVEAGNLELAEKYMGRAFSLTGIIVKGDQIGRTMGFPTANLAWENEITPKRGVYACSVEIEGYTKKMKGVMNCGFRPTVGGLKTQIEAHILDFDDEIYDARARYTLRQFIRPEMKFDGLQSLKEQIKKDVESAERYFMECP